MRRASGTPPKSASAPWATASAASTSVSAPHAPIGTASARVPPRPIANVSPVQSKRTSGGDVGERGRAAVVDEEAEFSRQGVQRRRLRQPGFQRADQRADIEPGVQAGERAGDDVAYGLGLGTVVEQAEVGERGEQRRQHRLAHAAQLQVGVDREIEPAVAVALGEVGQSPRGPRRQDAAGRLDAHDQPVAGLHRPQRAGAPAFAQCFRHCERSEATQGPLEQIPRDEALPLLGCFAFGSQ